MFKANRAKSILQKMKDTFIIEEGERIFYATANKQGRDPKTFHKESIKILDNLIVENAGLIIIIHPGTEVQSLEQHCIDKILHIGIAITIHGDRYIASDCKHNIINFPDLVGQDITELMNKAMSCAEDRGMVTNVSAMSSSSVAETVGTGAIAMIPNSLENSNSEKTKNNKKKKKKKLAPIEASNSQVSPLQLDH